VLAYVLFVLIPACGTGRQKELKDSRFAGFRVSVPATLNKAAEKPLKLFERSCRKK